MIKLADGKLELFESPDEITQDRWILFNKFLLQTGSGSTLEDIEKRHYKLDMFLKAKKFGQAIQERKNLHLAHFNTLMGINFDSLAFACLVHKIDGKEVKVETAEEAEQVSMEANKIVSHKEVENYVLDIKKKIATYLGYTIQADTQTVNH